MIYTIHVPYSTINGQTSAARLAETIMWCVMDLNLVSIDYISRGPDYDMIFNVDIVDGLGNIEVNREMVENEIVMLLIGEI